MPFENHFVVVDNDDDDSEENEVFPFHYIRSSMFPCDAIAVVIASCRKETTKVSTETGHVRVLNVDPGSRCAESIKFNYIFTPTSSSDQNAKELILLVY